MIVSILAELEVWYNLLDPVDTQEVDIKLKYGQYAAIIDKYRTSPGFPRSEELKSC
jgi:hypothetical protein